jgi:hypothetical protein
MGVCQLRTNVRVFVNLCPLASSRREAQTDYDRYVTEVPEGSA